MKYKETEIEIIDAKIIVTNNVFESIYELSKHKIEVITKLTKIKDLFKVSKSNVLYKLLFDQSQDLLKLLNQEEIASLKLKVDQKLGEDVISINYNVEKILKIIFETSDDLVSDEIVLNYLEILDQYLDQTQTIALTTLSLFKKAINKTYRKLKIILVAQSGAKLSLIYEQISLVVFDLGNEVVEVLDYEKFKSWLELKCKTILKHSDIEDYFKGQNTFNAFLISKALNGFE